MGVPGERAEHVALLFDLLAVAWQADLTRVGSFMMGRDVTYQSYPEIGVTEGHHPLSHHGNNPSNGDSPRSTPTKPSSSRSS